MMITRSISIGRLFLWTWKQIAFLTVFIGGVSTLYALGIVEFEIPWLPMSVLGTAVAFYVGFKNNQSYDRMWEARKLWGGIVNESRIWGFMVDNYVSDFFSEKDYNDVELYKIKQRLIHRHIGWMYAHRRQLLKPKPWEHISQNNHLRRTAERYQSNYGLGLIEEHEAYTELQNFISKEEYKRISKTSNHATQLLNEQSRDLKKLREMDLIEDFRHMEMENVLGRMVSLQGGNERIKGFPLPRQYANMSRIFVFIFILLLPFSMVPELSKIGILGSGIAVPITVLIAWVYLMMETIGDYSENPFQGMSNDIPMLAMCRTIEIDMREMLDESDIPPPIEAKNGILM